MIEIREAGKGDWAGIWPIFREVVAAGETYVYPADLSQANARRLWTDPPAMAYVAVEGGQVLGTYSLRPNQIGRGRHVANAGYVVSPIARGRGLGRLLCEHSLEQARRRGYRAMQFNMVVSTNESAVRLWQRCGFDIVGRLPGAFEHPRLGDVDGLVMYQRLGQ